MFGIFKAARQRHQRARKARHELIVAFDKNGGNFMRLDPVLRQALLKEAMATDAHWALINFMNLENAVTGSPKYATAEDKAAALREIYRTRTAKFDTANPAPRL